MNRFFPTLPYAETHYKFKLPWSPLFRPWPEVFLDGPSFCIPDRTPNFYLVLKDADYFPVRVKEIDLVLQGAGGLVHRQKLDLDLRCEENLSFIPLSIDFTRFSGEVSLTGKITVENKAGKTRTFLNSNFPGITPSPLRIRMLKAHLPYPEGWYAGEMHCHSDYSNDPVEYGAPLEVLQQAGGSLGLGFVMCTDHSYDFYYRRDRYMERTDPEANFQAYRSEATHLNLSVREGFGLPVMIAGEEVSCGNHRGENVHLLVAGHGVFLPGLGDGGRRWLNNKPDLRVEEVLERLSGTPSFSAHPRSQVGALESWIFRRGMWHEQDMPRVGATQGVGGGGGGLTGLQFWNGHRGNDFQLGRDFWVKQLLEGKRLLPIGANDAHGDLNRNIGVKTPLFSLYENRRHVFGHVRTVVRASKKSVEGIQDGLRNGPVTCTDGPFLSLGMEEGILLVAARSSVDYGTLEKIALYAGRKGEGKERLVKEWDLGNGLKAGTGQEAAGGPMQFSEFLKPPARVDYVRAEARTVFKGFALTSPLWFSPA